MMEQQLFYSRRARLHTQVEGAILLPGLGFAPKNYAGNPYAFRQDSHFLYFTGLSAPALMGLMMPDGSWRLYGSDRTNTEIVWQGPSPTVAEFVAQSGMEAARPITALQGDVDALRAAGTPLHFLPPYRDTQQRYLAELLHVPIGEVEALASSSLAQAVYQQRAVKHPSEIAAIEASIAVSKQMYHAARAVIKPGATEQQVMGEMVGVALKQGYENAFLPIVTVRGEVLHNNCYSNTLVAGDMLLIDTGVERAPYCLGSDITRTYPVSDQMTERQLQVYQTVLRAQQAAIAAAGPGVKNSSLHQLAAVEIVRGLIEAGLMKGDPEEAVAQKAHRLFFPHGIGHMLGLDSHDMEDIVALVKPPDASENLRFSEALQSGYVITVEPGIYFIPPLMDAWQAENKCADFICYDQLASYRTFGGVRIEDDLLITEQGARLLGPAIEK